MKPIRCPSSRILAISGLLLGTLLPLLRAPHARAQATKANVGADQAADTSYLKEMPDPPASWLTFMGRTASTAPRAKELPWKSSPT